MSLRFDGPEGGAQAQNALSLAFLGERPPHAVLLEGEPGSGTDRLAAALARVCVCLSREDRPCGTCAGCRKALAGSHPDIHTVDGDTNPRAFSVDTIRAIRSDAYILPNEAPKKAFVLLGAQNMSEIAQNALLKVLEEPPESAVFILTATSAAALLPTVLSRVQTFSIAGGSLPADWTVAEAMANGVLAPGEEKLQFAAAGLLKDREVFRETLRQLTLLFRDALVRRSGGTSCLSGREETVAALCGGLTRGSLARMEEEAEKALGALAQNANMALLATVFCAKLRGAAGR